MCVRFINQIHMGLIDLPNLHRLIIFPYTKRRIKKYSQLCIFTSHIPHIHHHRILHYLYLFIFAEENRFVKLFILFAFTSLFYYFLTCRFFCRKGKKYLKNTSNYQLTKVPFVVIKKPLTCSDKTIILPTVVLFVGGKVSFAPPFPYF